MRDGQPQLAGLPAGERHQRCELLRRKFRWRPRSRLIGDEVEDDVLEVAVRDALHLGAHQQPRRFCPSSAPAASSLPVNPESPAYLLIGEPVGGVEDDACPLGDALRRRGCADEALEDVAVARNQVNGNCSHPAGLILRSPNARPARNFCLAALGAT